MRAAPKTALVLFCLPFLLFGMALFTACAPDPARYDALMKTAKPIPTTITPRPSSTPRISTPVPSDVPLSLTPTVEATPAGPTALPTFATSQRTTTIENLTIDETFLRPAGDYTLQEGDTRNDAFYSRIPKDLIERHSKSHQAALADTSGMSDTAVIETLKSFGFRLEGQPAAYSLYKGDGLVSDKITSIQNFQVNRSKTDFAMLITVANSQVWLVQKNRFELYYDGKPRTPPIFIRDNLLTADIVSTENSINGVVRQGDKVIYTYPNIISGPETCPVDFFRAWNDHWVLQINGEDIMDGKPLGQPNGYQTAFDWFLIDQKPVYLFQKGNTFGVSYNGKELPLQYDEIARSACAVDDYTYPFGAYGQDGLIDFYAQKEGNWYYVQISGSQTEKP